MAIALLHPAPKLRMDFADATDRLPTGNKASYGSLCTGMALGWTSPVLPMLRRAGSPLATPPKMEEESWLGSVLLLGGLLGPLITLPLSRRVGRRWIIMGSNLPLLLGWLLAGVAKDLPTLYAARVLWGITVGIQFATVPIYIGEIAEDEIRGALGTFFLLFINMGFFLVYLVGKYASYKILNATGGILSLFYVPLTFIIPESPFFLLYKERDEQASEVLQKLRGRSASAVRSELEDLQAVIAREYKQPPRISDMWATRGSVKAIAERRPLLDKGLPQGSPQRSVLRGFVITICAFLVMLLQLSGIDVLLFYMEELVEDIGTSISAPDVTIILAAVQVVAGCICPLVVDRLGRKLLMATTSLGIAVILTIIGVYAFLKSHHTFDMAKVGFIPLLSLAIYMVLFSIGVGPIPWVLVAEMFPLKTRSLAGVICSFSCWTTGFFLTRYFRSIEFAFGIYTAFWILAVCCGLGFIFSLTLLPETKGKTFDEIQDILNNKPN